MNTRAIKHHPDDHVLAEYSAGSLDYALCISVNAHLHYCSECSHRLREMNDVGGAFFSQAPSLEVDKSLLDQIFARIDSLPPLTDSPTETVACSRFDLPPTVEKLIPSKKDLHWKRISPALREARLQTGQSQYQVALHKIGRGGRVVEHDHRGLEVTVVLKGSFSDEEGIYQPGDFIVKDAGEVHRPCAAQDQDCLCLTVQEAPIQLTGILSRLLNPFIPFHAA